MHQSRGCAMNSICFSDLLGEPCLVYEPMFKSVRKKLAGAPAATGVADQLWEVREPHSNCRAHLRHGNMRIPRSGQPCLHPFSSPMSKPASWHSGQGITPQKLWLLFAELSQCIHWLLAWKTVFGIHTSWTKPGQGSLVRSYINVIFSSLILFQGGWQKHYFNKSVLNRIRSSFRREK